MVNDDKRVSPSLRVGGPCSCAPGRVVRHAIPPVPGLPDGEVSCRLGGSVAWKDVHHHDAPAGSEFEVFLPPPSPDGSDRAIVMTLRGVLS